MFDGLVLWLTAVITIGFQLSFFAIAYWNQFDKLTDLAGGSNFFINAIVALLVGGAVRTCVSDGWFLTWFLARFATMPRSTSTTLLITWT